jgi:hypothetical protein
MRKSIRQQLSIVEPSVNHPHARELQKMSEILDGLPEIAGLVRADLVLGLDDPEAGREGMMSAE